MGALIQFSSLRQAQKKKSQEDVRSPDVASYIRMAAAYPAEYNESNLFYHVKIDIWSTMTELLKLHKRSNQNKTGTAACLRVLAQCYNFVDGVEKKKRLGVI